MTVSVFDKSRKNLLINGDMYYSQRSTLAVNLTTSPVYNTVDRFTSYYTGTFGATPTAQQITSGGPSSYLPMYCNLAGNFSNASAMLSIKQRIESIFAKSAVGQNVSFLINYYSESCNQLVATLSYPTAQDNFTSISQIATTTLTITNDSAWHTAIWEGVSIPSNGVLGLDLTLSFQNAQTLNSVKNHRITGITLVVANKAPTNFCYSGRDGVQEFDLCRRYYETNGLYGMTLPYSDRNQWTGGSYFTAFSTSAAKGNVAFIRKRIIPTVTLYDYLGNANKVSSPENATSVGTSVSAYNLELNQSGFYCIKDTGTGFVINSLYVAGWKAEAEL